MNSSTQLINQQNENNRQEEKNNIEGKKVKIFRFKFSHSMIEEMKSFSRIHQYDDKQTFKEAWNEWKDTHHELIQNEYNTLKELGFNGNIKDKIYKSIRYYYCKKINSATNEPKKRRKCVPVNRNLLTLIDRHILMNIENIDHTKKLFKPSIGFSQFALNNNDVENERERLQNEGLQNEEIELKLKKTYKNRYFLLSRKS